MGSPVANTTARSRRADICNVSVTATGGVSVAANAVSGSPTTAPFPYAPLFRSLITDLDSSETLTDVVITFTGDPAGMTVTGGTLVGHGLTIPAANVATAGIRVPADWSGSFSGSAGANTNEGSSSAARFHVSVTA